MPISDQELRSLVREAIARHLGSSTGSGQALPTGSGQGASPRSEQVLFDWRHASHLLLPVAGGSEGDGACLIEPTVRCNHCGYCQSYGH